METGKEIKKNSVVYILLPLCVEAKYDVFFNALKCVVGRVARAKYTEHFLDDVFKSALTSKDIVTNGQDLSTIWSIPYTKEKAMMQSKFLAFWTRTNYPKFGRIFHGDDWHSPNSTMTEEEINNVMFGKMKCYIVQLTVCDSTLVNLKHFVRVPANAISLENEVRVSRGITTFDIKENSMNKYWTALKRGEWIENEIRSIHSEQSLPQPKRARLCQQSVSSNVGDTPRNLMKSSLDRNAIQSSSDVPVDLSVNVASVKQKQQEPVVNGCSISANTSNKQLESVQPSSDVPVDLRVEVVRTNHENLRVEVAPTRQELQERVHVLERQLILELQKSAVLLESELSKTKSSLVQSENNNRELQLQISEKNETLAVLRESVDDIQLELVQKNESLAGIEKTYQLQLAEIQMLQFDLKKTRELLAEAHKSVSALNSELNLTKSSLAEMEVQSNEKNQLFVDVQKSNVVLQAELKEKIMFLGELEKNSKIMQSQIISQGESLVANEKSNQDLQLQLNEKNCSLNKMEQTVKDLQLELIQKNELLTKIEQSNRDLHLQLTQTNTFLVDNQQQVVQLESEMNRKNSMLSGMEKSYQDLQLQLDQTKGVLLEAQQSIGCLESKLNKQKSTLAEVEQLKAGISETIIALESELSNKNQILADFEKSNNALRSELKDKNELLLKVTKVSEFDDTLIPLEVPTLIELLSQFDNEKGSPYSTKNQIDSDIQPKQSQPQVESNNGSSQYMKVNESYCSEQSSLPLNFNEKGEALDPSTGVGPETLEKIEREIVETCRPVLMQLEFGWIKFNKNEKFRPGFVYPTDPDGITRAVEVTSEGYTSDEKLKFSQFEKDIPEDKKKGGQVRKLKLLNKKFGFDFK